MFDGLVLLVSSYDGFAVCWAPFCHGLEKYWPDHPPVFFITNTLEPPCGRAIQVGADRGWAGNLEYALSQIESDYILYSQEDYWIQKPVDSNLIEDYLQL